MGKRAVKKGEGESMEEIALLNPRRRGHSRRRPHSVRRVYTRHVMRKNPRRRRNPRAAGLSLSGIKGIFSKENIMGWVYLGGGFMVGVAAEKTFGNRVAAMVPVGQDIPIVNALTRQIPLIAGVALFGKSMPKQAVTGMQAYIGYRLINSALQMANINLSGIEDIGYIPSFGLRGLYSPTSSASLMGVSDQVMANPSF